MGIILHQECLFIETANTMGIKSGIMRSQIGKAKQFGRLFLFVFAIFVADTKFFEVLSLSTNTIEMDFIDDFADISKIDKYEELRIDTNLGEVRITGRLDNEKPYSTLPQILESISIGTEMKNSTWVNIECEENHTGKTDLYVQANLSGDGKTWDGWLRKGMVSFTFDDGYFSTYNSAFPILQKYGFLGVIYVINDSVNYAETGNKNLINLSMLHTLEDAGWEIGGHSKSHKMLTTLSDDELRYEISESYLYLKNKGFNVTSMAYPFGIYDQRVIDVASDYFEFARGFIGFGNSAFDYPVYGKYALPWFSSDGKLSSLKDLIDLAESHKKWVIFTFHDIKPNDSKLEALAQYVKSKNVDVVTVTDGMSRMNCKDSWSEVTPANMRYAKYRAIFFSDDGKDTPILLKVNFRIRIYAEELPALDINGDGRVSKEDLQIMIQHFGERVTTPSIEMSDANRDGIVNILDIILFIKYSGGMNYGYKKP
jgi:peptidoglycan/xylan/chitin deacetylase (PgdA/CDA1 family)